MTCITTTTSNTTTTAAAVERRKSTVTLFLKATKLCAIQFVHLYCSSDVRIQWKVLETDWYTMFPLHNTAYNPRRA